MVDAKARQDCIKEIELLKSLDHPNIIRYLASFIENNEVCYIYKALVYLERYFLALHCVRVSGGWRPLSNDKTF